MMILALLFLLGAPAIASAETWAGRLAIGPTVYVINGNSTKLPNGIVRYSLSLAHPNSSTPLQTVVITLSDLKGEISFGADQIRALPQDLARKWRQQLLSEFRSDLAPDYVCQTKGDEEVCDSRTLVRLDDSLVGRLRLIYNQGRLAGVRFFSLAEWTNPFYEYVSLSLDIH